MPVATITQTDFKEELKSLPGGYVVIRRMTYGERLTRQQMAMKMQMKGNNKRDSVIDIEVMNRLTTLWSFANLIVEHNLTAYNNPRDPSSGERPLNFRNVADVELLDTVVGEEVDRLIDRHNNFEEDAGPEHANEPGTLGNSNGASAPQS